MPKAIVTFQSILQDSQDYATFQQREDHVVSVIEFTLQVEENVYSDMKVEVCQPYGTEYEAEPLEVGAIFGSYKGNWDQAVFASHCEKYYRSHIGSSGKVIRTGASSTNVRMRNNKIVRKDTVEFEIPPAGSRAWSRD